MPSHTWYRLSALPLLIFFVATGLRRVYRAASENLLPAWLPGRLRAWAQSTESLVKALLQAGHGPRLRLTVISGWNTCRMLGPRELRKGSARRTRALLAPPVPVPPEAVG